MERPVAAYGKVIMPESVSRKSKYKNKRKTARRKFVLPIDNIQDIKQTAVSCVLGFLFGGASVFGNFNPIGMAFVSAHFGKGARFYVICMAAFLGYVSMGGIYGVPIYIFALSAAAVSEFFLDIKSSRYGQYINAVKGSLCFIFGGVCFMVAERAGLFLAVRIAAEAAAVFSLAVIFEKGAEVLNDGINRHVLSDDKFILAASAAIIAICALGSKGFFGFAAAVAAGSYIILLAGYSAGSAVGCAAGAVFAFSLIIMAGGDVNMFMMFSIAGLCGGAFNSKRALTAFSFAAGTAIPAFYTGAEMTVSVCLAIGAAIIFFVLTPEKVFENINTFASHEAEFNSEEYFMRIKELTNKKLKAFAGAFGALAGAFETAEETEGITPKGAGVIIDDVSRRVCESCSMSLYCWRTKSFEVYGAIQQVIGEIETNGAVNEKNLPSWLKNGCVRLSKLTEETVLCVKEYKTNMAWQNRMNESRNILREQLKSVEKIVGDLGSQVVQMPRFNESIAKEVRAALERKNIEVKKVFAVKEAERGYIIYVTMRPSGRGAECRDLALLSVNRITGRQFVMEQDKCSSDKNGFCTVAFKENQGLVFETAVSKEVKSGSSKTGDTAFSGEYEPKKAVMALCDGMGSGEEAARQSLKAIDLTKKFVKAGFDLSLTLKVLNSALSVGRGDMYTTLDICSINLFTGECEIIKNGGSTIFIYSGGEIRAIRSTSLPVGVICDWQGERTVAALKSGDSIIMVTDGITDAFGIENEEKAVAEAAARSGGNVDKMAALIVEAAKRADGGQPCDDMTVVVGRVI